MNDRTVELLEQYDMEVLRTRKGRGSILCETDKGCLIFKEYMGSEEHAKLQNRLLQTIEAGGSVAVEQIVPDKEGNLLVKDADETAYILKTWRDGREVAIYDKHECIQAVELLAKLHLAMEMPSDTPGLPETFCPGKEYEKHNREMKRIRKYLKQKGQKQTFEMKLLSTCDFFINQALDITREWNQYSASFEEEKEPCESEKKIVFCHGDYQYHNILTNSEGWFIVNFEKCMPDNPIRDLYLLLRKLLEKSNWSVELGSELLSAYERVRSISARDYIDLYYRLAYPEKFWKIMNFYFNSGKAWIPGKNQEKLEKLIEQEKDKQHFLDEVFRKL